MNEESKTNGTSDEKTDYLAGRSQIQLPEVFKKTSVSKKLFGTDGIRGQAGIFPMTPDVVVKVGQALGHILTREKPENEHTKVVIGKDTRISGYMVEQALACGLNSVGVHVQLVGPLPTPGIGFLAQNMRADAGLIISASHNPYCDNGIKIFGPDGFKISDQIEREIEELVFSDKLSSLLVLNEHIGRTRRIDDAAGRYIVYAKNSFPLDLTLEGTRIVLDCANGASYKVAPLVFEELGAEVMVLNHSPNGFNINKEAGSLHVGGLVEAVKTYRADLGVALDGDADRIIMVDEEGQVVDGDSILALSAVHLKSKSELLQNKVVATTMSNMALDEYLKEHGIDVVRVSVGDKNVVKAMRELDIKLGGEQSGHIIFLDHSTTGDGIVAALKVLEIMKTRGVKLSKLNAQLEPYPQVQKNLKIQEKRPFEDIPGYGQFLKEQEQFLKGQGRILVRYSGTEKLVRILVEGKDRKVTSSVAESLERFLKKTLC